MKKIVLVAIALLMSACASYKITPEHVTSYNNGIQVMTSTQAKSKVQLEIAQSKLKGLNESPLVLYVAAQVIEEVLWCLAVKPFQCLSTKRIYRS